MFEGLRDFLCVCVCVWLDSVSKHYRIKHWPGIYNKTNTVVVISIIIGSTKKHFTTHSCHSHF